MLTVTNKSGRFLGKQIDAGVTAFLGIQYAIANRFSEPSDCEKYFGDVNATAFGPQSPQVPGFMEEILNTKNLATSEDCLYLNIWKPNDDRTALPVLFWIHGGAYTNGTAATSWYDGANLVKMGGVIVVSINYRLGPFGFISENILGILDQISALRWVTRNIESFGGDPTNVTIFGESAGGSSVIALTASTMTRGLIHKAWAMSPSLLQLRSKSDAEDARQKYLTAANCSDSDDLRHLTTEQMIDATAQMFLDVDNYISTFSPTVGGAALPDDIYEASARSGIPLVLGTNRDESRLWTALNPSASAVSSDDAMQKFVDVFDRNATDAWRIYGESRGPLSPIQMIAAMQTEQNFRAPAWRLLETRVPIVASWMYWFTWPSPVFDGAFGCCHALDLPFMFNNLDKPNVEMFTGSSNDRELVSGHFTSQLLRFAKTAKVDWPKYSVESRATLCIDTNTRVENDPESEIRELWSILN